MMTFADTAIRRIKPTDKKFLHHKITDRILRSETMQGMRKLLPDTWRLTPLTDNYLDSVYASVFQAQHLMLRQLITLLLASSGEGRLPV
ncbi:hypothetical protein I5080_09780 [Salmonella enterica]|nr:hypothetical protein I5080_09780 [Salmonella enterica]